MNGVAVDAAMLPEPTCASDRLLTCGKREAQVYGTQSGHGTIGEPENMENNSADLLSYFQRS